MIVRQRWMNHRGARGDPKAYAESALLFGNRLCDGVQIPSLGCQPIFSQVRILPYTERVYACGLGCPTGQKTLRNVSQNRNRSNIPTGLCRRADTATARARPKVRLSALQAPCSSSPPPDRYERLQNTNYNQRRRAS